MANPEHLKILKQGVEVWNQWRNENPGVEPDLSEADLHYSGMLGFPLVDQLESEGRTDILPKDTLNSVNFSNTNLSAANLSARIVRRADLSGTNLQHANLEGTNLRWTSLKGANLQGQDLWLTDVRDVDFSYADLTYVYFGRFVSGATFEYAKMGVTTFNEVDFRLLRGLDLVEHKSASFISTDCLYLSRGELPGIFLRGAGVPEDLIEFLPSLGAEGAIQFYSCFISYSHTDKSFARRLHDKLQARGIRCWLDEHQVLPGDDIYDMVDRGIRLWDKVLLCCSEAALTSWWVNDEIDKALEKEQKLLKDRGEKVLAIIPLNLDGYLFDWQGGRAATLRKRLAADFTVWEHDNAKFEEQFERVVKALRTEGRQTPPESKL